MPIHSWNWFRAVGVGNDLKSWYGDNPQVIITDLTQLSIVDFEVKMFSDLYKFISPRLRMDERVVTRSSMTTCRDSTRTRSTS